MVMVVLPLPALLKVAVSPLAVPVVAPGGVAMLQFVPLAEDQSPSVVPVHVPLAAFAKPASDNIVKATAALSTTIRVQMLRPKGSFRGRFCWGEVGEFITCWAGEE